MESAMDLAQARSYARTLIVMLERMIEATSDTEARDAAIRAECVERAWPLLKQEYEWRHEDSECGGDEISEGLDMLKIRLRAAIMGEDV